MKRRADDRVAADADAGGLAEAGRGEQRHDLIGQRAGARDEADRPSREDVIRHDADLAGAGGRQPGTVGADQARGMLLEEGQRRASYRLTGMFSVMQTTSSMPASAASMMASAAPAGGTKMQETLAPVCADASRDRVEDGHAVDGLAAFAGRDAADDLGAGLRSCCGCGSWPSRPVMPCTITRDVLSNENAHRPIAPLCRAASRRRSSAPPSRMSAPQVRPASASSARPSSSPVPERRATMGMPGGQLGLRHDDAPGDLFAARDAAEDVDEDALDLGIARDEEQRLLHHLGLGAAADVEEVGRLAARARDHVERRHDEAGAVADDADVAVELDVGEARRPWPRTPAGWPPRARPSWRTLSGAAGRCRR